MIEHPIYARVCLNIIWTLLVIAFWMLVFPGGYWLFEIWMPRYISWLHYDDALAGAMVLGGFFGGMLCIGMLIELWKEK